MNSRSVERGSRHRGIRSSETRAQRWVRTPSLSPKQGSLLDYERFVDFALDLTVRLTIQACLPTWRTRVNPRSSNSSTVPLKRKRSCASRPRVVSEIASTRPPPARAIWETAPSSATRAIPCPRRRLSTKMHAAAGPCGTRAHALDPRSPRCRIGTSLARFPPRRRPAPRALDRFGPTAP